MKTLRGRISLVCVLATLSALSVAQTPITITSADISTQLAVGNVLTNVTDSVTTSVNIGAPGASSWDFSGLKTSTSQSLTSVALATAYNNGLYPTATHALKTPLSGVVSGVSGTVSGDLYLYVSLGTNLLHLGDQGTGTITIPPFSPIPGSVVVSVTPPDTTYGLPLQMGAQWGSTYTDTTTIYVLGNVVYSQTISHHAFSYTVDAYGQMTIPGGTVHDALRIRSIDTGSGTTYGFIFVAKDGSTVQITATDASTSGTITVQKGITWSGPTLILPVQLSAFTASLQAGGSGVILRWTTLSEVNNFGFEVQRAAQLQGDFQTIANGFVPGHGTTTDPQQYSCIDNTASAGTWYYRLRQIDLDGTSHLSDTRSVQITTGVAELSAPAEFSLAQNYPNPFNPATMIRYGLPQAANVRLEVFNTMGQLVSVLVNSRQEAGYHDVRFDGAGLASGVYFYRLTAGSFVETRRLLLLR